MSPLYLCKVSKRVIIGKLKSIKGEKHLLILLISNIIKLCKYQYE